MSLKKKHFNFIAISLVFLFSGVYAFISFQGYSRQDAQNAPESKAPPVNPVSRQNIKHNHQISGLHFTSFQENKKVLDISSDEFLMQHKKVGVFRFGLMREAVFKNAHLDIYFYDENPKNPHEAEKIQHSIINRDEPLRAEYRADTGGRPVQPQNATSGFGFDFSSRLAGELQSQFKMGNVSAIIFEPIYLKIHHEGECLSMISAHSATMDIMRRKVFCRGGVKVESGQNVLRADELTIFADSGLMTPYGDYALFINGQRYAGDRLRLDFLLNNIY